MSVLSINKNNFEEIKNSPKPVLLDFFAEWCGPCRMVSPIVDEIANEHPEFLVAKINVDEEPELAANFGVMSIPTLVVMKDGKIMQNDTPQMLYNHPQNMFVAGFIGSPQMNFIYCKIVRNTDGYYAQFENYNIKLPNRMNDALSLYTDKEVVLGIRPENIHLAKDTKKKC